MKNQKKISAIASVVLMSVTMFYFSSCKKEDVNPTNANDNTESNAAISNDRFCNFQVFPPVAHPYGHSYAQWSAKWWKWAMEFPLTGHPFVDDPSFNVSQRQSGPVWFLAAPFGTVVRNCNIPPHKSLLVGLLNAEASDLEGLGITYVDQHANAKFNADHIHGLTASLDGNALNNINAFRFASHQFSFTAPTPWIFGTTGGAGTSSADGYYLMLKPLHHGTHVLHYTGNFHFAIAEGDPFDFDAALDMTYNLNVQ